MTLLSFFIMDHVNYFELIARLMPPEQSCFAHYVPHVTLVTQKALRTADRLGLSQESRCFIEEAAMLHDVGIITSDAPGIGCFGSLPYLQHGIEGRIILEQEGLPRHALVAERHLGVGITKEEIAEHGFPLPRREMMPTCIEERIICWADLFFSKTTEKLWHERSADEVRASVTRYGERSAATFEEWNREFAGS